MSSGVRLQKVLSMAGVASRRASETMIQAGRVSVNGTVVTTLGTRVDPGADDIRVDGRRISEARRRRYVLVNKPAGMVTTRHDPERRATVLDLVPKVTDYVYPVGRLDYASEGLLILTNDGELAARMTHPRHSIERVYEAVVSGVPTAATLRALARGVVLDGRRTAPAEVRLLGGHRRRHENQARVRVTLTEGRNRQVRRMFTTVGHPVIRLRRTRIGPLTLRGLGVGKSRDLTSDEVKALKRAVGLPVATPRGGGSR